MMHHRSGLRRQRIALAIVMILVTLAVQGTRTTPASAASAPASHGPAPGSGTKTTPPFVRVLDGKSFEAFLDNVLVGVVIVGIDVAPGNSACGMEATRQLTALAQGGLILEEDSAIAYDSSYHRLYSARTHDGRVVAEELVKAGVAKVNGVGEPRHQYTAAEADARAAKRGCLWNGGQAPQATATARPQPKTASAAAVALPGGFRLDTIASGLFTPTGFAFAPGRLVLITEKAGRVRLVKNGILQTNPVIDISDRVNSYGDRGLNGMAIDPNFATNGYLYLIYTYEDNPSAYDGAKTARVARYTVVGDTASPASEVVILGTTVGSSCNNFAVGTDCIVSDGSSHSVGSLRFASDGTLFVSFGDGASFNYVDDNALRAQNIDIFSGKLLHVTSAGLGVPGNPFWNGDAHANRSKVWAYGFRNPFRFSLQPGSDTPYVGDVGWDTWEEVDVGVKGGNYGWPCYEGGGQQGGYASKSTCQTLYSTGTARPPLTQYNHNGQGAAVVGGVFYTGANYPAQYRGTYFYGDYARSTISTLTVDGNNALTGGPTGFATNADGPVDFATGPDSDLYYIAINTGELRHIVYGSASAQPVIPKASANVTQGAAPLTVQFSSAGTTGPVGQTLTYDWEFDDGTPGTTEANPTHQYTRPGVYDPVLFVYDGSGNTPPTSVIKITVGTPPTPRITAPSPSLTYAVGDTINFSGSATDPVDGAIPGPQLTWQIIQHHCPGGVCHTHYFLTIAEASGSFVIPDHGDNVYYEIILTAVDAAGLTGTTSVSIYPPPAGTITADRTSVPFGQNTVNLTFGTSNVATAQVYVSVNGGPDALFASGPSGSQQAGFISSGTFVFKLFAGTAHTTLLASVTVTKLNPKGGTGPALLASPAFVAFQPGTILVTASLGFDTGNNSVGDLYVRINNGHDALFTENVLGGQSAPWIQSGTYTFTFKSKATGATLDTATIAVGAGLAASPSGLTGGGAPGGASTKVTYNSGTGAPAVACVQGASGPSVPLSYSNSGAGIETLGGLVTGSYTLTLLVSANGAPITSVAAGAGQCTANVPLTPAPSIGPATITVSA